MLYMMSLGLFSFLSHLAEMKLPWQIPKPRTPFSHVGKNLSSQLLCMVGKAEFVVGISSLVLMERQNSSMSLAEI